MAQHKDSVFFRHMLDHARTALELAEGKSRADLHSDRILRYALLHLFCILGEAANRVSEEARRQYPAIPWRDVIGMRNVLIHGYDAVDLDIVWNTVTEDLSGIIAAIEQSLRAKDDAVG